MTRRIHNADTDADIELRSHLDERIRPCFVMVAGAGSGKTTSLVKALDHVGKCYGSHLRSRGQRVACITYTEVATGEIWGDVGNNTLFHVSTIHSFLWSLARPFQKEIGAWVQLRIQEKLADLEEKAAAFGPRTQQRTRDKASSDMEQLREQLHLVAGVDHFTYESGSNYQKGFLGHDDIIKMVPYLIREKPLLCQIFAQKYPFCFVDESQDTFPDVASALKSVATVTSGRFCLGFFGDPMQKIYGHGVGDIIVDFDHIRITKPENFRCPSKVLSVINRIRADGDKLEQKRGRMEIVNGSAASVEGRAKMFILPADGNRTVNLQHVRQWMADDGSDPLWLDETRNGDVRILVIVHRMAAARLGFPDLFSAFNDGTSDSVSTGFREGTSWALKPFLEVLLPLALAHGNGGHFEVMTLLRNHCQLLDKGELKNSANPAKVLTSLKQYVVDLSALLAANGSASVLDIIKFVEEKQLIRLDERFQLGRPAELADDSSSAPFSTGLDEDVASWLTAYLSCPAKQFWGYYRYLMESSPYSTQQGIKGAEFERVIVVLDDEESQHRQYSYEKLLGLKAPSDTDLKNIKEGKETVVDRTRRLFYVCCSRATRDLAVVLYSKNVEAAVTQLRSLGLFAADDIKTLVDMSPESISELN